MSDVKPGDHVVLRGWPGVLFVLDVLADGRVELLGQAGVRLIARSADVRRVVTKEAA